jgi:DNA-binding NtrC family response regulator
MTEFPVSAMPEAPTEETLLLVDPDHDFLDWASKHLAADKLRILRCDNAANGLKVIEKTPVGVVIAAMSMQPFDGLDLLDRILQVSPQTLVILTAGFPTTSQIIEATQRGAHDVLRKEALPFELRPVIESALQIQEDRRSVGSHDAEAPSWWAVSRARMRRSSSPAKAEPARNWWPRRCTNTARAARRR